ncbi:MAG TPA: non-ribosomal peptide synthetase [Xanthomonadales bacterium]|nr:non-ribosomal peptide synthetase [Xanthomonadales bacterium]
MELLHPLPPVADARANADLDTGGLALAADRGARTALVAPGLALDYATLARAVDAACAAFALRGAGPGRVVAVAASRDAETIVAILALLRLRAAYLPLDLSYPAPRLAAMLEDARPMLAVGSREALARMPAFDVPHCAITIDPAAAEPAADRAAPFDAAPARDDALAYVLFTSGSTGRPKGVAMRRAPLAHLVAWHAAHPRLGKPARTLQFAPLSFDVHFQEIATTYATGGTLVLVDEATRRNPAALLEHLASQRIERLYLPYVALHGLAEAALERGFPALALRDVVSAGEQLRVTPAIRALFSRLPGAALHNHYGPTETHVVTATTLDGDPSLWPELPSIGTPLPHVEIAFDEDGGLLLGGDCLAAGYVGRDELTAERFVQRDGARWYATGDRVERRADGALDYLGRLDQQLKIGGFRVEPAEVELALLSLPEVRAAAVGARALEDGAPALIAWVVARDENAAVEPILAQLRARLPAYLVPARVVMVDALPTTASGKIDHAALPAPDSRERFAPALPAQDVIAALWREELSLAKLEPDLNLFDAGASSLGVARFVAALRRRSTYSLGIGDVYAAPTVRGLARRASGAAPGEGAATHRGEKMRAALGRWRTGAGARA